MLWIWLSFVANGGCGLRYGGVVVGLLGFFWIWVWLLRWWLWLAEVVVMEDDDDWPSSPPSSATPSSCSRSIVRRGRTGWELRRERETDSKKGERKSNKEMRGERKVE